MLDASYVIIGKRAVRATIDFRIYARVLLEIAREREKERLRERERKKERLRERKRKKESKRGRVYLWRRLIPSLVKILPGSLAARDAVVNDINVINTVILLPSLLLLLHLSLL